MSDTKALDEILKVAKCTQFPFEMIDQAAAELAELKRKEVEFDAVYKLAEEINDKNVQLRTDLEEARERLGELEQAEYNYRADHDVLGDGSIEAGRAWDHMRHCGERSRAFLKAHPERKGNDMSDTKALERALNLVLENDVLCASYGGVFREAAAELAELKAGISGLKSDNGQLGMYNERANLENKSLIKANVEVANLNIDLQEQNAQLRAEVDKYDSICTAVRNELTNAGVPELTDDRLAVVSLVARVALLRANRDIRQSELDEAIRVIKPFADAIQLSSGHDPENYVLIQDWREASAFLKAHPERK